MSGQEEEESASQVSKDTAEGWGSMGGHHGDGFRNSNEAAPAPPPPESVSAPPVIPPNTGNLTRYAPPEPSNGPNPSPQRPLSYAERSAQAYQHQQQTAPARTTLNPTSYLPPGHPHMVPPTPYSSPSPSFQATTTSQNPYQHSQANTNASTTTPTSSIPYTTSSYAARSAQAYSQQPPTMSQSSPVGIPSYAARSAYAPQTSVGTHGTVVGPGGGPPGTGVGSPPPYPAQPQPSPQSSYAARSAQTYTGSNQFHTPVQQSSPYSHAQAASSPSYAVRSAQTAATPSPSQPPMSSTSSQSYAARSAQAYGMTSPPTSNYYGASSSSPQQHQQPHPPNPYLSSPPSAYNAVPQSHDPNAIATPGGGTTGPSLPTNLSSGSGASQTPAAQERLLNDATRKVQEHAYYMKQAMEQNNLPVVLDRAAHMVGELGGQPPHQHGGSSSPSVGSLTNTGLSVKLNPKNYYELYMRTLDEIPVFEDYLVNLVKKMDDKDTIQIVSSRNQVLRRKPYTIRELYDCVLYCPRVVSRLYLQISTGSVLIRSGEVGAKWVLNSLLEAVRCEQNPIRGLFLRNYLLTALRDKLPDDPLAPGEEFSLTAVDEENKHDLREVDESEKGNVRDSYEFILENFMEMNKLWVRIQHLPGDGKSKEVRKRRERERNDLRVLVGTNLVRLSQLENVTSKIYGEVILPRILEHIVTCGDPLSQAYLMDSLVQAFPDEYHIETLPILLNVCPRLRDKVNIRTILQGLMERLAKYLGEEDLLDENDTNEVKLTLARDSFGMFEECVQKVYNARGPKLTAKEVIRLQSSLIEFSIRCYPGDMDQIGRCLGSCVSALRQASASYEIPEGTVAVVPENKVVVQPLDEGAVTELEKMLAKPLDSLSLKVLELEHYADLVSYLPLSHRKELSVSLVESMNTQGATCRSVSETVQLLSILESLVLDLDPDSPDRTAALMTGLGVSSQNHNGTLTEYSIYQDRESIATLSRFIRSLKHDQPEVQLEMLEKTKDLLLKGKPRKAALAMVSLVHSYLDLFTNVATSSLETKSEAEEKTSITDKPQDGISIPIR